MEQLGYYRVPVKKDHEDVYLCTHQSTRRLEALFDVLHPSQLLEWHRELPNLVRSRTKEEKAFLAAIELTRALKIET